MNSPAVEDVLSPAEVRVIGALIEKELTTPDYYPLTVKALTNACNQKSNRDPIVSYTEENVSEVLDGLQRKRLLGVASGAYSRVARFRHTFAEVYGLSPHERALLAELFLRGPQTPGELRARAARMADFDSLAQVEEITRALESREEPLIVQCPRRPGQKETRFAHLFAGEPELITDEVGAAEEGDRLERLESELAALKEQVSALEQMFESFRKQFE